MEAVLNYLREIERKEHIRVLYACVVGSRAYGQARPDSDYDLRYVFAHEPLAYITVDKPPVDVISEPELLKAGVLDVVGFEVTRFVGSLNKANQASYEMVACSEDCWVREFTDDTFIRTLRDMFAECVATLPLACGYYGALRKSAEKCVQRLALQLSIVLDSPNAPALQLASNDVVRKRIAAAVEPLNVEDVVGRFKAVRDSLPARGGNPKVEELNGLVRGCVMRAFAAA